MDGLHDWLPSQFAQKKVEPNSSMGGVNLGRTLEHLRENPDELQSGDYQRWKELYDKNQPLILIVFGKKIHKAHRNGDYSLAMGDEKPIPFFAISAMYRLGRKVGHETYQVVDMA